MVPFLPSRLVITQKRKQTTTMQFSTRGFDEKGAATARPDGQVNFLDQILGENDVCSLRSHALVLYPLCHISVLCLWIAKRPLFRADLPDF
jgi:hypothetical protein